MVSRLAVGVLVVLVTTTGASADSHDDAKLLFDDGRKDVTKGKWDEGCAKFRASFELEKAIGTKLNLAECEAHAENWLRAYRMYDEAVREDDNEKRAAFSRDRMTAIAKHLGSLVVEPSDPEGVTLEIDGDPVDEVPYKTVREPGPVAIVARAKGYPKFEKRTTIGAGETLRVIVPAFAPLADPDDGPRRPARVHLAIGLGIGGVVALLAGGAFGLEGRSEFDDAFTTKLCVSTGPKITCNTEGAAQVSRAHSYTSIGNGLAIGGGVLLVTAAIVFATAPRDRVTTSTRITPTVSSEAIGIAFGTRF